MKSNNGPQRLNRDEIIRLYAALMGGPMMIVIGVFLIHVLPSEIKISQYFLLFWKTITHPVALALWFAYFLFIISPISYFVLRAMKLDSHSALSDGS